MITIQLQATIIDYEEVFSPSLYFFDQNPGVSFNIDKQFPDFVSENHPRFISFIQEYYKWMESQRNVDYDIKRIKEYQDIDTSVDEFTEQFFREFLVDIPRNIVTNKANLLKNIKQFYRARGTEKSYRLFFRFLYGLNVEFYYPRVDILKVSDGKWVQDKTIRVTAITGNISNLRAQRIRGATLNSTAFVERVFSIKEGPLLGYELVLNRSSITGEFGPEEIISSEDGTITAAISPAPSSYQIVSAGSGYEIGQKFYIENPGYGIRVEVIDVDSNGAIQKLQIIRYGLGYRVGIPLINRVLYSPTATEQATINLTLGSVITYPGFYSGEDGQLSTDKYIHDGEFYQQFSYVLYVDESLVRFKEFLNRLLHPAGFKMFGGLRSVPLLNGAISFPKDSPALIRTYQPEYYTIKVNAPLISGSNSYIFNILNRVIVGSTSKATGVVAKILKTDNPLVFELLLNNSTIRKNFLGSENITCILSGGGTLTLQLASIYIRTQIPSIVARPKVRIDYVMQHKITRGVQSYALGPTNYSVYRDRFKYKPVSKYNANTELLSTPNYFGVIGDLPNQKAITPIASFDSANLKPVNTEVNRYEKTNLLPDAVIISKQASLFPPEE